MIMGRKTYASIGQPLDGRDTIVVTRAQDFSAPGVHVAQSIEEAIALGRALAAKRGADEVAVIGGEEVFRTDVAHGQPHLSDPRAWAAPRRHPFRASGRQDLARDGPGAHGPGSRRPVPGRFHRVGATSLSAAALGLEHSLTPYNPITWVQLRAPGGCPISNKKQADFLAACDVMRALLPAGRRTRRRPCITSPADTGKAQSNALE